MRRKESLKTLIVDNQSTPFPGQWSRNLMIPLDTEKIITLAGVRRSGKTYHLFHAMERLVQEGIKRKHIIYINFEDERLNLEQEELDLILQAYRELYPDIDLSECYFFFDEIQEVTGWEKFIARLYASISKNIFITGSNAKLLSQEIATALRGRTITFEVYPLSFAEYCAVLRPGLNPYKSTDKAHLLSLFNQFMHEGGFPEVIKHTRELRDTILQEYFNVMLLRDLIERYNISQASILKYFCKRVIGASAGEFSVNKIYNELRSQGYQIAKDTLYAYQDYVEAIYLNRFVMKYSPSVVKSELSQRKTYVIDQGLGTALNYKLSEDKGKLLENTVALELIKQGKKILYNQNGTECDFVVVAKDVPREAIQVSLDVSDDKTKEREVKGLLQACEKLDIPAGIILTRGEKEDVVIKGKTVHIVPAWEYFLA